MNAAGLTPAGWVAVLVSGMLFGAGLTASTMVRPEAILAFLRWQDFGLLFVMGGAALVTGLAYAIAPRVMRKPAFATRFGVHPSRLAHEFRARLHAGPGEYLRALRLAWAAEQLQRADATIADVASRAGFYDQSHFSRMFRRQFGVAPAAWRRDSARRR